MKTVYIFLAVIATIILSPIIFPVVLILGALYFLYKLYDRTLAFVENVLPEFERPKNKKDEKKRDRVSVSDYYFPPVKEQKERGKRKNFFGFKAK